MAERVQAWWARRQFSTGRDVPYPVGTYRETWAPFPALIRQYHPDLNDGITLTQIPPAADVLLLWQCEAGHRFAATPAEQRSRPGRERRRSAWCPDCTLMAVPRRAPAPRMPNPASPSRTPPSRTPPSRIPPNEAAPASGPPSRGRTRPRPRELCPKTPELPTGEPFVSACAPRPASAVEGRVRADVFAGLGVTPGITAVRVGRAFFDHLEVWPDILLPELRVAIEYDSTGRHGLEHVGDRETGDRRKDRALRASGWEVVRLRTGRLEPLGPHDLQLAGWNARAMTRLLDVLRDIRGPLLVDAYLR